MRELTIEEKAARYDAATERANNLREGKCKNVFVYNHYNQGLIEYLFPELQESEDTRIINNIKKAVESYWSDEPLQEIFAWLEKQSTPQVRTGIEWVNTIDDACDKRYSEEYAHGEYCHEQSFKWGFQEGVDWLEKQGAQRSNGEIDNLHNYLYGEQKPNYCHHEVDLSDCSEEYRKAYYDGWNNCNQQHEQLKAEQKYVWSKEDEDYYDAIIAKLEVTQDAALLTDNQMEFLKSLKERYTWKPSDEQINELHNVFNDVSAGYDDSVIESLYNDLKKLREE